MPLRIFQPNDSGSMLMEFVLVLPVYFALMGGTFAVGERLILKNKLLLADRLYTLNTTLHHSEASPEKSIAFKLFNPSSEYIGQYPAEYTIHYHFPGFGDNASKQAWNWTSLIGGYVQIIEAESPWTFAWLSVSEVMSGSIRQTSAKRFWSSSPPRTNYLTYALKRTLYSGNSIRSERNTSAFYDTQGFLSGFNISPFSKVWYRYIYDENYPDALHFSQNDLPDQNLSQPQALTPVSAYNRFLPFVYWGQ